MHRNDSTGSGTTFDPTHALVVASDADACFDLGRLARVDLDADERVVRLAWTTGDGLLASALDALGPSRPERFPFDSPNRYEDVAATFRTVADALDVPVNP
ncbi:hypothetical protein [Halorubellus salinus]|uniref:hypothetical protein n=1 Tax=Halorubellus salinus TaxID=755309 RepID=UPI001D0661FC|nr:hypothetical protein [Halorubellus salinus]